MTFEDLLNHSVNIQTRYSSQNSFGEWTYTYSSASTSTKCRLTAISDSERVDPTGRFDDVRYFGYFESSAALTKGNRVTFNGEPYRIKECILDQEYHHKEVLLSELVEE